MKRIFISEEQKNIISEALNRESSMPFSLTVPESFKSEAFPIDGFLDSILAKRYEELKSCFSDDITSFKREDIVSKLSKLSRKCIEKERNIRPQLEKICLETVMQIFNLPDEGVEIDCNLCDEISPKMNFHIHPDTDAGFVHDSIQSMQDEKAEIEKRRIINMLVAGGANALYEKARKCYIDAIFELDEELPHLYSKIMKINDYLVFTEDVKIEDEKHYQGSYVNVVLGDENKTTKIECKAMIFPLLLEDTIKGILELIASHGLPDSFELAERVLDAADVLENDPWNVRLGTVLWKSVCGDNVTNIPEYFLRIIEMPCPDFFATVKEVFAGTKKGKEITGKLVNDIAYGDGYSDFQTRIQDKQKAIIADGYFTEEELDEAAYPSNFNMEEFKSLSSFAARVRYCEERLNRISQGSSRIVYTIDNNTVLKLAKNKKGIAQNEEEGQPDFYKQQIGLFAEVYDVDENYLWIEMQLAKKAKPSDFKRITGYDFNTVCEWLNYIRPDYRYHTYMDPKYKAYFNSKEFQDNYDEYSILAKLQEYVGNYDAPIGDLKRISSWGIVTDENGQEDLVLIDFGLSDDIYIIIFTQEDNR